MTEKEYILIAKLLEQKHSELFGQLCADLRKEINIQEWFNSFCQVKGISSADVIGKPYNRQATYLKSVFVGVLFKELQMEELPRGKKKEVAAVLRIPPQNVYYFLQNVIVFLKVYPDFETDVSEIYTKIKCKNGTDSDNNKSGTTVQT